MALSRSPLTFAYSAAIAQAVSPMSRRGDKSTAATRKWPILHSFTPGRSLTPVAAGWVRHSSFWLGPPFSGLVASGSASFTLHPTWRNGAARMGFGQAQFAALDRPRSS